MISLLIGWKRLISISTSLVEMFGVLEVVLWLGSFELKGPNSGEVWGKES
jgi:hypothetical protein